LTHTVQTHLAFILLTYYSMVTMNEAALILLQGLSRCRGLNFVCNGMNFSAVYIPALATLGLH